MALGLGAAGSALTVELGRGPVLDAEDQPDPKPWTKRHPPQEAVVQVVTDLAR